MAFPNQKLQLPPLITLMPFPGSLLLEVGMEFNRIKTEKKKKR